jgi:PIN domain nuclease of toxin-antitoxin system
LAISDIALLELTTLSTKERIRLNISFESFLREIEARFIVLPISGRICVRARMESNFLIDQPEDRQLIARVSHSFGRTIHFQSP